MLVSEIFSSLLGQHGQGIEREIFLDVKTGVEAKNYDDVSVGQLYLPSEFHPLQV